jgi:hypothetical protein
MSPKEDRANPPLPLSEQAFGRRILIQRSALAGFRHHAAPTLWPALRGRDRLALVREVDNLHDPDAVAVYWKGLKIGYLPRGENFVVARLLDQRRSLSARVGALRPNEERNRRIRLEVVMH